MYFIVWSGFGLLVPVVALLAYAVGGFVFGLFMPAHVAMILSSIAASAALIAAGLFFKKRGKRRHLYWIPMEYWSVATAIMGMAYIPKLFGA
jgi:hypothetical protein